MKIDKKILNLILKDSDTYLSTRLICLCSGGVDSIAAAHFMYSKIFTNYHNFSFSVLHINHNYRPQNELMADSVRKFCNHNHLYKIIHRCQHHPSRKTFTEDYLRKCRMEIMELFASKYGRIVFFTGHHLDDCVENYLLNCIRGHPQYTPLPISTEFGSEEKFIISHPFILNKKQDMIDYCIKNDLMKYVVEDETNHESKGSRRNMIRNEILPILERDKVGMRKIVKKMMIKRLNLDIIKG